MESFTELIPGEDEQTHGRRNAQDYGQPGRREGIPDAYRHISRCLGYHISAPGYTHRADDVAYSLAVVLDPLQNGLHTLEGVATVVGRSYQVVKRGCNAVYHGSEGRQDARADTL